jgi:hypothetical protein
MVAALRQEENDRLHAALYDAVPYDLRTEMVRLLEVPEKRRVSEWVAGAVDAGRVPAARMTGLARYGLSSKAPTLKRLEVTR